MRALGVVVSDLRPSARAVCKSAFGLLERGEERRESPLSLWMVTKDLGKNIVFQSSMLNSHYCNTGHDRHA